MSIVHDKFLKLCILAVIFCSYLISVLFILWNKKYFPFLSFITWQTIEFFIWMNLNSSLLYKTFPDSTVCIEMHTLRNGANVIEKWFSGVFSKWLWIENGNFFFTFSIIFLHFLYYTFLLTYIGEKGGNSPIHISLL